MENVSGRKYESYLGEELFGPAGMTETGYTGPRWDMKRMSRNYSGEKDNGFTFNRNWGPDGTYWHCFGNGCILTTTGDLVRWEQALQSHTVLSAEALEKLWTPHVPASGDARYAYGWRVGKSARSTTWIGHGGGSGFGVSAAYYRFPEDGVLVLVLSNLAKIPGMKDQASFVDRLVTLTLGSVRKMIGVALLAAVYASTAGLHAGTVQEGSRLGEPYDVVIANARILDGTGNPWYRGDIGIRANASRPSEIYHRPRRNVASTLRTGRLTRVHRHAQPCLVETSRRSTCGEQDHSRSHIRDRGRGLIGRAADPGPHRKATAPVRAFRHHTRLADDRRLLSETRADPANVNFATYLARRRCARS